MEVKTPWLHEDTATKGSGAKLLGTPWRKSVAIEETWGGWGGRGERKNIRRRYLVIDGAGAVDSYLFLFWGCLQGFFIFESFVHVFYPPWLAARRFFWRIKRILIISHFADVAQRRERVWLKREPNIEWEKQWKGKKAFQNSGNLPRRAEKGKHFTEIEMKTSWFSVFLTAHEKWLLQCSADFNTRLQKSTMAFLTDGQ